MLSAIKWVIKASIFAVVVLVIANSFKLGGKTISDQVKTKMAQAERLGAVHRVQSWAKDLTQEASQGARALKRSEEKKVRRLTEHDSVSDEDRESLKNLIEE